MKSFTSKPIYDYIGIASSGLCFVHCISIPTLLFLQQYYQQNTGNITIGEGGFYWDYLFVLVSFIAVYVSTQNTDSSKIKIALWSFFILFAFAILFEEDIENLEFLGYFSSVGLMITHFLNIKYYRKCQIKNFPLPS
jgi:hypothetical protein